MRALTSYPLDTYNTDPERAEKALEELEKAFDMPYMGIDRCDDATRNYLRENIDKAKLGDPSGFTESIRANYTNKESIAPKKIVVFIDNIFMFFLQFYKIYFI